MKKGILTGGAFALLFFLGCNQEEKIAAPTGDGTGELRMSLPAIPDGFAKQAATSKPVDFVLVINGSGMAAITKTWRLSSVKSTDVSVTGIPAGPKRYLNGYLIRRDTAKGDSVLRQGKDSVAIAKDSTTFATLLLRKVIHVVPGKGNLGLCVQVEGLPPDTSCVRDTVPPDTIPPDTIPHDSGRVQLGGCWSFKVTKGDSVFAGRMTILQSGTTEEAILSWTNGIGLDSAMGRLKGDSLLMGPPHFPGSFVLHAVADTDGMHITGAFSDSLRRLAGKFSASRTPCVVPPDSILNCYHVAQANPVTTTEPGSLSMITSGASVTGVLDWAVGAPMPVAGSIDTVGDSTGFKFTFKGKATAGMIGPKPGDTLIYAASLTRDRKNIRAGKVSWKPAGSTVKSFGTWFGTAGSCLPDTVK